MAVDVEAIFKTATGGVALNAVPLRMFNLPFEGAPYWHGTEALLVERVEPDADPPRVHLAHDSVRQEGLLRGLPDGYTVDAGRDPDTGQWNANVVTPEGGILGGDAWGSSDSCDRAVVQAVAGALEMLGGR